MHILTGGRQSYFYGVNTIKIDERITDPIITKYTEELCIIETVQLTFELSAEVVSRRKMT